MVESNTASFKENILKADEPFPKIDKFIGYGTAGFRTNANLLDRICFRSGILTAIKAKTSGLSGMMLTASHNLGMDNGVKIMERSGHMMEQSWE